MHAETIDKYDLLLSATHHDVFDSGLIRRRAKLILGSQGVYAIVA